ncbi:hypothetical protein H6P81_001116 [Aristolochia fimbriata]|uniref:Uncharacterized protein n=1 Tax=Aristolochia fimbriata TaxID=158543 RepID=A0AAV7F6A5_ARIFI|nr:hypothetical protein H6P81_001116 [Aristolochia fimbriata]
MTTESQDMSLEKFGEEKQPTAQGEEEQQEMPMPILARLDRLDRLVLYLEETRNLPARRSGDFIPIKMGVEKQLKPLSSALDEVHFKGTLLERIDILENRVLQLSLVIEDGSTSSSSTFLTTENIECSFLKKDDSSNTNVYGTEHEQDKEQISEEEQTCTIRGCKKVRKQKAVPPVRRRKKWLGWLQMGC